MVLGSRKGNPSPTTRNTYSGNANPSPTFGPTPFTDPQPPRFYECGICGHNHPVNWDGDCRNDANRFTDAQLDDKYGEGRLRSSDLGRVHGGTRPGPERRRMSRTSGYELAGSGARYTAGFWAVWFTIDNARHGKKYPLDAQGEHDARAHFARLTTTL